MSQITVKVDGVDVVGDSDVLRGWRERLVAIDDVQLEETIDLVHGPEVLDRADFAFLAGDFESSDGLGRYA